MHAAPVPFSIPFSNTPTATNLFLTPIRRPLTLSPYHINKGFRDHTIRLFAGMKFVVPHEGIRTRFLGAIGAGQVAVVYVTSDIGGGRAVEVGGWVVPNVGHKTVDVEDGEVRTWITSFNSHFEWRAVFVDIVDCDDGLPHAAADLGDVARLVGPVLALRQPTVRRGGVHRCELQRRRVHDDEVTAAVLVHAI